MPAVVSVASCVMSPLGKRHTATLCLSGLLRETFYQPNADTSEIGPISVTLGRFGRSLKTDSYALLSSAYSAPAANR